MYWLVIAGCLICFAVGHWARLRFFRKTQATTQGRGGLRFLGLALSLAQLVLVVGWGPTAVSALALGAVVAYGASALIFIGAVRAHGERRPAIASTAGAPESLVTSGIYKVVRHPFYSSYLCFWLAGCLAVPGLITVSSLIVMMALYWRTARGEEIAILGSPLGFEYARYRERTGMFLPRLSAR